MTTSQPVDADGNPQVLIEINRHPAFVAARNAFNDFRVLNVMWRPDKYNTFSQKFGAEPAQLRLLGHTLGTCFTIALGVDGDGGYHPSNYYAEWHWELGSGGTTVDCHVAFSDDGKLKPATNIMAAIASFCTEVLMIDATDDYIKTVLALLEAYHAMFVAEFASVCRTEETSAVRQPGSTVVTAQSWRHLQRVVRRCATFTDVVE